MKPGTSAWKKRFKKQTIESTVRTFPSFNCTKICKKIYFFFQRWGMCWLCIKMLHPVDLAYYLQYFHNRGESELIKTKLWNIENHKTFEKLYILNEQCLRFCLGPAQPCSDQWLQVRWECIVQSLLWSAFKVSLQIRGKSIKPVMVTY